MVAVIVSCQSSGHISSRLGDVAPLQSMLGRIDSARHWLNQMNSEGLIPPRTHEKIQGTLTEAQLEIAACDKQHRARILASHEICIKVNVVQSDIVRHESQLQTLRPALACELAAQKTLQDEMISLEREGQQLQQAYRSALEDLKESASALNGTKLMNARIKFEIQEKLIAEHAKRRLVTDTKLTKKNQEFSRLDQSCFQVQSLLDKAEEECAALAQQKTRIDSDIQKSQKKIEYALFRAGRAISLMEVQIAKLAVSNLTGSVSQKSLSTPPIKKTVAIPRTVPHVSWREVSVERTIQTEAIIADDNELGSR